MNVQDSPDPRSPPTAASDTPVSRRTLLLGSAGAAAGVAGLTAGIGVGAHEVPPVPGGVSGRKRFMGKVVMITGGTSGIGRAAAIAFARMKLNKGHSVLASRKPA